MSPFGDSRSEQWAGVYQALMRQTVVAMIEPFLAASGMLRQGRHHDHCDGCGALQASVVAHHWPILRDLGEELSSSSSHYLGLDVTHGAGTCKLELVGS